MRRNRFTRRQFIAGTAAALAGGVSLHAKPRYKSPNSKLNVAAIGAGGKGVEDIAGCESENIVALCDVDFNRAAESLNKYPNAARYRDYRIMLEKQKDIDAVTISTADHSHAPAALWAMQRGIHVYVQKPLTHTIHEARTLLKAARRTGVATQMGNQGHADEGVRQVCEIIWSGAIGPIREAHVWTDRPIWPQNCQRPTDTPEVPDYVDWDLFLGTAPERPYHPAYHPVKWRGWWDFGTGAIGDMACHVMDAAFMALRLEEAPVVTVEAAMVKGGNEESGPESSIIRYEFPQRGEMPPVTVYWYDGGELPPRPKGLAPDEELGDGDNGSLFIGDDGMLTAGIGANDPRLLPVSLMEDFVWPDPVLPRSSGIYADWIAECKGGKPGCSHFEYTVPLTEIVLLGNVAIRAGSKIEWDSRAMKVTNNPAANQYVTKEYRKGWELPSV